jgi:Protein of unknown function (DUF962)
MPSEIGVRNLVEFWPVYLRAHSHPGTRAFHYAATLLAFTSFILTPLTGNGWFCSAAFWSAPSLPGAGIACSRVVILWCSPDRCGCSGRWDVSFVCLPSR